MTEPTIDELMKAWRQAADALEDAKRVENETRRNHASAANVRSNAAKVEAAAWEKLQAERTALSR